MIMIVDFNPDVFSFDPERVESWRLFLDSNMVADKIPHSLGCFTMRSFAYMSVICCDRG